MTEARPGSEPGWIQRIRTPLGAARRYIRRLVTGLLHPYRRRRVLADIRGRPVPRRVLSMCLGNICRSPYVEAYLRHKGRDLGIEAFSRGFIGPDRSPPPEALKAARNRNVDTREHISRLVEAEDLRGSDLVILVDPRHAPRLRKTAGPHRTPLLVLGDLDPENTGSRTIQDPWGNDQDVFDAVFERLDRCMEVLLDEWRKLACE